jgi:hypothetical protein
MLTALGIKAILKLTFGYLFDSESQNVRPFPGAAHSPSFHPAVDPNRRRNKEIFQNEAVLQNLSDRAR